jgi:hypothetical protein
MKHDHGATCAEIATELGLSERAVERIVARALGKLRKKTAAMKRLRDLSIARQVAEDFRSAGHYMLHVRYSIPALGAKARPFSAASVNYEPWLEPGASCMNTYDKDFERLLLIAALILRSSRPRSFYEDLFGKLFAGVRFDAYADVYEFSDVVMGADISDADKVLSVFGYYFLGTQQPLEVVREHLLSFIQHCDISQSEAMTMPEFREALRKVEDWADGDEPIDAEIFSPSTQAGEQ